MAQTREEYYAKFGGGEAPLMSGKEYRAKFESGELPVETHYNLLRITFIYVQDIQYLFRTRNKLHEHGWSFGRGDLKFNYTLDIFYISQIICGLGRTTNDLDAVYYFPDYDDFDCFYVQHRQLLDKDAWKRYYSPGLLMQPISARYYRLPDLQHLPDSDSPIGMLRNKSGAAGLHATKLLRWATEICRIISSQLTLPIETMRLLAISTLKQTILRLREDFPNSVQLYSETQTLFWLRRKLFTDSEKMRLKTNYPEYWGDYRVGMDIATGLYDPWEWEAHYSPERWVAGAEPDVPFFEPDLEGTRPPEVEWAGWPNGGLDEESWHRGWDPEVGSEEVVAFLVAVAIKETDGVSMGDTNGMDFSVRSHILLAVMKLASEVKETESHLQDLKQRLVEAGRLDEAQAESWIRNALMVMKPYLQDALAAYPENWSELFGRILTENGQLFGRWRVSSDYKFNFRLKRHVKAEKAI